MIKKELQTNMLEYLRFKFCTVCGEKDIRVLEFDHIEPKKKLFGISNSIGKGMAWPKIATEIKKCRVLCANCHRKHTAIQQGWYGGMFKEL